MEHDTTRTRWPVCPHCGLEHRDAWEWHFGPGLDGDAEVHCDRCGELFSVSRIVDVSYTTKAPAIRRDEPPPQPFHGEKPCQS